MEVVQTASYISGMQLLAHRPSGISGEMFLQLFACLIGILVKGREFPSNKKETKKEKQYVSGSHFKF